MEYARTHGLLPTGLMGWPPKLMSEVAEALQAGEQRLFADVLFIVEEPRGVRRLRGADTHPVFRATGLGSGAEYVVLVEIFTSNNMPVMFSFFAT